MIINNSELIVVTLLRNDILIRRFIMQIYVVKLIIYIICTKWIERVGVLVLVLWLIERSFNQNGYYLID